jgi:putative ABC transport system permease protein
MLLFADNLTESLAALRAHKLRAVLTIIGLTMGVATLITVMTIVQGANSYVENKIATMGTNVFQLAKTPFAATNFDVIIKALRYKDITLEDMRAVAERCPHCELVGASVSTTVHVRAENKEVESVTLNGHTANMASIDTRNVLTGRYFTESEDAHAARVCLVGNSIVENVFGGVSPLGRLVRVDNEEFEIIGTFEKLGSVLGQDADNFVVIPLNTYLHIEGMRNSLTINAKATAGKEAFELAQDEARQALSARRHVLPGKDEDFFIGTKESYISLWKSISGAFFSVFLMVSGVSAVVGGIVIMNVMLVSVTERTKEIGVRRALGATKSDIMQQFLAESVMQCLIGGVIGIAAGFTIATLLNTFTSFPASVQTWVAALGVILSSVIGLFFGIYPATRAAKLDPVVALRSD